MITQSQSQIGLRSAVVFYLPWLEWLLLCCVLQAQKTCSHLTSFVETVSRVNASEDTSELVNR